MVGITHVHGSCQLGKSLPSILAALGGDGPLRRRHARAVGTGEPGGKGGQSSPPDLGKNISRPEPVRPTSDFFFSKGLSCSKALSCQHTKLI